MNVGQQVHAPFPKVAHCSVMGTIVLLMGALRAGYPQWELMLFLSSSYTLDCLYKQLSSNLQGEHYIEEQTWSSQQSAWL